MSAATLPLGSEWQNEIPDELPVDTRWDDVYQASSSASGSGSDDPDYDFDARNSAAESLQDHLIWQLNLTRLSETDRLIATSIIDAIDTNGRLRTALKNCSKDCPPIPESNSMK